MHGDNNNNNNNNSLPLAWRGTRVRSSPPSSPEGWAPRALAHLGHPPPPAGPGRHLPSDTCQSRERAARTSVGQVSDKCRTRSSRPARTIRRSDGRAARSPCRQGSGLIVFSNLNSRYSLEKHPMIKVKHDSPTVLQAADTPRPGRWLICCNCPPYGVKGPVKGTVKGQ